MTKTTEGIPKIYGKYDKELSIAIEAAQNSGTLLKNWSKPLKKEWKGEINPVTSADKASENILIKTIVNAFPDDIIISEESNPVEEKSVKNNRRWYIDPLDGTVNYIRGIKHWCISIALVDDSNKVVCSVVYNPLMEEMYTAMKGKGAWCNGERISVSNTENLNRSVAASGFPYSFDDPLTNNLTEWSIITPQVLTVRSLGAAAIDLCQVAKGRIDIFWEQGLERWDLTAASLICSEAGAKVTDMKGRTLEGPNNNIIVANPILHAKVTELFSKIQK
ncbi:inositol monophosphatase family protein [Neobacillus terrae]|uniref:inositol monophosphatase family protein n=1 Tax=Neobacillus terrae TaxID=3034837 RepID=UPI00140B8CED|nr:inositol monophosphatase family protein [Neobacillus terrae]NHM32463.1 inositol monophosphatase [Neobacillus terrae]